MNDSDGVRTIDQGTPPARFARGWHCLGLADRFRDSGPHAVQAFGTKLVVFADSAGCAARPRRVLPAHGRRPDPGHDQGRRASPARSTTGAGAGTAGAPGSPTPGGSRPPRAPGPGSRWSRTSSCSSGTTRRGTRRRRRRDHPADRGRVLAGVEQLDLGLDPGRGGELPRDHRQRGRHGALLLHPLRLPDLLQERVRGAHRLAVPAHQVAAGRRGRLELRRRGRRPRCARRPPTSARPT